MLARCETPKKKPHETDIAVGTRIRARRMMFGMSQTELGNRCGITFQQIQKYEKGTNRVGSSRLKQVADILQAPVSFFFGDDGQGGTDSSIIGLVGSSDAVEVLLQFNRITDSEMRSSIVTIVRRAANISSSLAAAAE